MKFDYYVLNSYVPEVDGDGPQLYAKWMEQVTLAEELGFDCAWFTEHHFRTFGGMLPSPQLLIAALAQRTTRIRLGIAVVILPFYNPVRIAEETAVLDILTDGRVDVGVGRGMGSQYYDVFGADPATAQEKLEEQVDLLRTAWAGDAFSWNGKYYQCPNPITLMPRPVQRPHPTPLDAGERRSFARSVGRPPGRQLDDPPLEPPRLHDSTPCGRRISTRAGRGGPCSGWSRSHGLFPDLRQ